MEKFQFSPLLAVILDLSENGKVNITKTIRDGVILSEFLTHRVVQGYPMQRGKILVVATFGSHLGF